MKKALLLILAMITACLSLLVTNFFTTKEVERVNHIEATPYTTSFYIRDSTKSPEELVTFFKDLAKRYRISIIKTDEQGDAVIKSGVFDEETFPVSNLGLTQLDFKKQPDGIYTNEALKKRLGIVSIFLDAKNVRIQQLSTYFKERTNSITGSYTITSTSPYSKDDVLTAISTFLGVTTEELTDQKISGRVGYVNQQVIITALILGILGVLLLLGVFLYPLMQMKVIGVMKTLGYSNLDIFVDYLKPQVLTLIVTGAIIDIGCSFLPAKPQNFMISLIWSQILILLLLALLSVFSFSIIQTITISAMLSGFNRFKVGEYLTYIVKVCVIGLVAAASFMTIPVLQSIQSEQEKYVTWHKYASDLVGMEYYKSSARLHNAMVSGDPYYHRFYTELYHRLEKEVGAYYIRYDKKIATTPPVLAVNKNYLDHIGLSVTNAKTNVRIFLVPEKLKSQEKRLKKQLSQYAASLLDLDDKQQKKATVPITINYYSQKKTVFSFNEQTGQQVTNPIFSLVADDIAGEDALYLATTGLNSPIKIINTKQNVAKAERIVASLDKGGTYLKWTSLSSMIQASISSWEDALRNLFSLASVFVVLNLAVSYFLTMILLQCKHQYLNTTRLLGWRLFDRFKLLMSILLASYGLPICVLLFLSPSLTVVELFGLYSIFDLLVLLLLINQSEKKRLADNLKRGEI